VCGFSWAEELERRALLPQRPPPPHSALWVNATATTMGLGRRALVKHVTGAGRAAPAYVCWVQLSPTSTTTAAAESQRQRQRHGEGERDGHGEGARALAQLRTDHLRRTPHLAAVLAALPAWTVPMGKCAVPYWLSLYARPLP
jgi:hypothetical protein